MTEFRLQRRIEFSDTDLAGTVHFSRFFVFMETAEDEFLRSLGVRFDTVLDGRRMGWPKVAASCEYHKPVHYGDDLDVILRVARRSSRTVTYEIEFRRGDTQIAVGRTTSVCCAARPDDGRFEAIRIPDFLRDKIVGPEE